MIFGEGVIISVGELLLTGKISTPGSYYLLVNDPRGVLILGELLLTATPALKGKFLYNAAYRVLALP